MWIVGGRTASSGFSMSFLQQASTVQVEPDFQESLRLYSSGRLSLHIHGYASHKRSHVPGTRRRTSVPPAMVVSFWKMEFARRGIAVDGFAEWVCHRGTAPSPSGRRLCQPYTCDTDKCGSCVDQKDRTAGMPRRFRLGLADG